MELKRKNRVEIFSAGKWNGDAYTVADLDEMIRAFDDTCDGWKPPLKLGHDENQKLLQSDGFPAAGYVGKLYRIGEKLYADFIDIPAKIFNLLEMKSYNKVSSEIFWDIDIGNDTVYSRMLAGVALLGADMPAVMNLSDITAWFTKARGNISAEKKFYADSKNQPSIKTYEFLEEGANVDKNPELEKLKADKVAADKELAELKKYKADQEAAGAKTAEEIAELKEQNRQAALDSEVAELDLPPGAKQYAKALLDTSEISEKKQYSVKIKSGKGDKAKSEIKKYSSRSEILAALLKVHAESLKLNTNEESVEGEEIPQTDDAAELDKKVRAYSKANKVSYGQALKAIRAEQALEDDGDEDEDEEDDE